MTGRITWNIWRTGTTVLSFLLLSICTFSTWTNTAHDHHPQLCSKHFPVQHTVYFGLVCKYLCVTVHYTTAILQFLTCGMNKGSSNLILNNKYKQVYFIDLNAHEKLVSQLIPVLWNGLLCPFEVMYSMSLCTSKKNYCEELPSSRADPDFIFLCFVKFNY